MREFWIIFAQSFITKAKTKAFLVTTAIVIAVMFLSANLSTILDSFKGEQDDKEIIVIQDTSGVLFKPVQAALASDKLEVKELQQSEKQVEDAIKAGEVKAFVKLSLDDQQTIQASYTSQSLAEFELPATIENALQTVQTNLKANALQLTNEQVSALFLPVTFSQKAIAENSKSQEELSEARGLVYVLILVLYISVFYYANMIAMEVATEKSSRVMEILISSVSPVKHMMAKIAGIGTLGLAQIIVFGTAGYTAIKTSSANMTDGIFQFFGFSNIQISTILYAVVFFILGYFLYATLAALLGSLVSRIEDVQQMLLPMSAIIIIASVISFTGIANPEATYVTVSSYIPPFTPMVMFLRVGMLDLPVWEPLLSIGLLLLTIFVMMWFGARVYRGGVLMYGASQSLKDIKKALQLGKK